jgi:Flp pilus assembly protein TadG
MWKRLWTEEEGAQSLEFVALLPVVILVMLTMLQIAFLGYAVVVMETSAREAALAASRDPSASAATAERAARQAAGGLSVTVKSVSCDRGDVSVELAAHVPNVLFESAMAISRKVTIPRQDGRCP